MDNASNRAKRPKLLKNVSSNKNIIKDFKMTEGLSISYFIQNYNKVVKKFICKQCCFSCMKQTLFNAHPCDQRLETMRNCTVRIQKLCDQRLEKRTNCTVNIQKLCEQDLIKYNVLSETKSTDCLKRLKHVENCNDNIVHNCATAMICNKLHQDIVHKEKQKLIKKAKICDTVDEVLENIVKPFLQINKDFEPKNNYPDLNLNLILPYENQKLLQEAANFILPGTLVAEKLYNFYK